MLTLEKVTCMTFNEFERRRPYVSAIVCKDDRGQFCIIGCNSLYFQNYTSPHVRGVIKTKKHISKAIISAQSRGRLVPNCNDSYDTRPVYFKVANISDLSRTQPLDVYLLS